MVTIDSCRREVERLHDRFAEWFTGSLERDAFERVDAALAPEFELVTPEGTRLEREAVVEWLRDSHARDEPDELEITVENVEVVESMGEHALVRYEEWETTPDDRTGRISTVLFREDESAPEGVAWVALHETALEADDRTT